MHYINLVNISHTLKYSGVRAMSAWGNRCNINGICACTLFTTANENAMNVAAIKRCVEAYTRQQELRQSHISNHEALLDVY